MRALSDQRPPEAVNTLAPTDEAIALVASSGLLSGQHAGLDLAKGLKDTLDVDVGEVRVHRRHIDPVEGTSFFCQLVDDWLSLADVTGPPHLADREEGFSLVL